MSDWIESKIEEILKELNVSNLDEGIKKLKELEELEQQEAINEPSSQ